MKKKLVTLLLAATMMVGGTLNVFAADNTTDLEGSEAAATGSEVTGESTVNLPVVKVTVPTTADIVINPFQMSYADEGAGIEGNSQIISAEHEISSSSNVAVAVNVADLTTTEVTEGISVATAALTSKVTTKSAFLYLEVVKAGDDGKYTFASAYDRAATSQVIIPNSEDASGKVKAASKDAIVVLDAAAGESTPSKAAFKIGGNVVANPVGSDGVAAPWLESDNIGISFKFTFTPQVVTATE